MTRTLRSNFRLTGTHTPLTGTHTRLTGTHTRRTGTLGIASAAALCTLAPSTPAFAFSEDLCVVTGKDGKAHIQNCLDARTCDSDYGSTTRCRANLTWDASNAGGLASSGNAARSMLHVDATFFIAQAVGFSAEAAYWISAYDELVDIGAYQPLGMDGKLVETWKGMPTRTPTMNGWSRSSSSTGGFLVHAVAPFVHEGEGSDDASYTGLYPNVQDPGHEGMLYHVRQWVTGDRLACTDGFTELTTDGSPYLGDRCYREDELEADDASGARPHLFGTTPMWTSEDGSYTLEAPFWSYTGVQIAQYTPGDRSSDDPAQQAIHDIRYADELADILKATYTEEELEAILAGRDITDLEALVRIGVYLHMLQDRISHHTCTDASSTSLELDERTGEDAFFVTYDDGMCSQEEHAYNHYVEIGTGTEPLPDRTTSALEYTYLDLLDFRKNLLEAGSWAGKVPVDTVPVEMSDRMTSDLETVLRVQDACKRDKAMVQLLSRYGFEQMPGHSLSGSSTLCR